MNECRELQKQIITLEKKKFRFNFPILHNESVAIRKSCHFTN